jgi:hypothetical protein
MTPAELRAVWYERAILRGATPEQALSAHLVRYPSGWELKWRGLDDGSFWTVGWSEQLETRDVVEATQALVKARVKR